MRKRLLSLIGLGIGLSAISAFGCALTTNSSCSPDSLTTSGSALTSLTNQTITTATFTATYSEWVFEDTGSGGGLCTGCLDFVFQVTNSAGSSDALERVSAGSFGAFLVDAGIDTTGGVGTTGTVSPGTVDRSATGSVVGFNFVSPSTNIMPGQTSVLLEIETNATSYTTGNFSAQDDTAGSGSAYIPSAATPEPMSMGLLGGGLALLGLTRLRRTKKA